MARAVARVRDEECLPCVLLSPAEGEVDRERHRGLQCHETLDVAVDHRKPVLEQFQDGIAGIWSQELVKVKRHGCAPGRERERDRAAITAECPRVRWRTQGGWTEEHVHRGVAEQSLRQGCQTERGEWSRCSCVGGGVRCRDAAVGAAVAAPVRIELHVRVRIEALHDRRSARAGLQARDGCVRLRRRPSGVTGHATVLPHGHRAARIGGGRMMRPRVGRVMHPAVGRVMHPAVGPLVHSLVAVAGREPDDERRPERNQSTDQRATTQHRSSTFDDS